MRGEGRRQTTKTNMRIGKRLREFGSKLGALTHAGLQGLGSALDEVVYAVSPRAGTRRKAYRKRSTAVAANPNATADLRRHATPEKVAAAEPG